MKISYTWLKAYVDLDIGPYELSDLLTDIGLEVEEVEEIKGINDDMGRLKVGQIMSVAQHPESNKLKIVMVDIGAGEPLQIVCGASNVAVGLKVVVATDGTVLYPLKAHPIQIKKTKIRGVESQGMICSEYEIGISDHHEDIIQLPDRVSVGSNVKDYYNTQSDFVLEIALTTNRTDAMGHIGVARDVAAALTIRNGKNYELHYPSLPHIQPIGQQPVQVKVAHTSLCPRYSGILLDNVTVQSSPQWLQSYLKKVGLRPINNIVDITNFVLLEYGQPLHAFDADKIEGNQISVTTVPEGTSFVTLDEVKRTLSAEDLMICDASKPICIAGVMGGLHSGVTSNTRKIFLESACFNPVSVRKTAHRHNLRTDAAQRFEKGTDIHITTVALQRAVSLLIEHAGARVASDITDIYPVPYHPYKVQLSYKKLYTLTGASIDKNMVKQILKKLEIDIIQENEEGLTLSVPLFKTDVQQDVDVIEEILRIYGYNRIPVPDQFKTSLVHHSGINREQWKQKVSDILVGMGFYEIMTNSIVHNKYTTHYQQPVKLIKSANADLNFMRPSMLITGLEAVAYNHNRRHFDLKFFEFGKTYHLHPSYHQQQPISSKVITEIEHLFLITTGNIISGHWHTTGEKADFFYLKGAVENILNFFGIAQYETEKITGPECTYGLKIMADQKEIAIIGCVDKKILRQYDIEHDVYYADCYWDNLLSQLNNKQLKFKDISRYPWVRRDLALLIDRSVSFGEIEKIAFREIKKVLKSVNLFDIYEDKRLGDNKKSYALSFIFEDEEKTLKDEEVDQWMRRLMEVYKTELNAEIR